MKTKFIRRDYLRYSKLGKNRRKLQKWRGAKGRDNKIRLSMKGYPRSPSIGFKKQKSKVKKQVLVYNLSDLKSIDKGTIVVLAKVGARKKLEIIKKASELKISLANIKSPEVQK